MRTERPEPILPARNLDETRAFYEKLGFVPWWRGRGPWEYEIVSRGHLVVHFFAEPGMTPSENDMSCYWRVKDADREGIPRLTGPVDTISTLTPRTSRRIPRSDAREGEHHV